MKCMLAKIKMNEISTPATISWILKDNATGKQLNRTNILEMKLGDITKIKLYNDPNSTHPISIQYISMDYVS